MFQAEYNCKKDVVVTDAQIITSQGPGTAFSFALEIIKKLSGEELAADVAKQLLVKI